MGREAGGEAPRLGAIRFKPRARRRSANRHGVVDGSPPPGADRRAESPTGGQGVRAELPDDPQDRRPRRSARLPASEAATAAQDGGRFCRGSPRSSRPTSRRRRSNATRPSGSSTGWSKSTAMTAATRASKRRFASGSRGTKRSSCPCRTRRARRRSTSATPTSTWAASVSRSRCS